MSSPRDQQENKEEIKEKEQIEEIKAPTKQETKVSKLEKTKKEQSPSVIPKIGQSSFSKFSRENHNRHRSERLIDRYLVKSEKEECLKYLEKLKLLQKINKKYNKKIKDEEDEERKRIEEEKKKEIQERREKYKDMSHYDALIRIMKHIQKPDKYSKWLALLQSLLKDNIDFFWHNTLLNIFDTLVKQSFKCENGEDREIIQQLYSSFWEYAYIEQEMFKPEQLVMIQNYIVPIHIESQFFTDDTFQFNHAVGALENVFDDLKSYNEEQDKYEADFEDINKIYNYFGKSETAERNELGVIENKWIYDDIEDFEEFNNFIQRKYFFNALKTLFPLYKHQWAKSKIKQLLVKIYYENEKFSSNEIEQLNKMMDEINNKVNSDATRQSGIIWII